MSLFADLIEQGRMFADVHLGSLTTYKLGGPARLYFEVRSEDDLGLLAEALRDEPLPVLVVALACGALA